MMEVMDGYDAHGVRVWRITESNGDVVADVNDAAHAAQFVASGGLLEACKRLVDIVPAAETPAEEAFLASVREQIARAEGRE